MDKEACGSGDLPAAVPMKFFSTWEIERTSPSCVARWCHLRLAKLTMNSPSESIDLQGILLAVSMKSQRGRTLRSTELVVPPPSNRAGSGSGGGSLRLDLAFSLQYPHYLKRKGNCLEILLQRRNRYKSKSMPGFKTLARGQVFMDQVLQHTLVGPVPLSTKSKTGNIIIAHVDIEFIESCPVSSGREPAAAAAATLASTSGGGHQEAIDEDLSGEEPDEGDDDDSEDAMALSDQASDSDEQAIETVPAQLRRKGDKMKRLMISVTKKRHWRKLFAFLKKVKIDDDEGAERDSDEVPAGVEELMQDSDEDSDLPVSVERLSSSPTPKPTLRPFFEHQSSIPSLTNFSEKYDTLNQQEAKEQEQEQPQPQQQEPENWPSEKGGRASSQEHGEEEALPSSSVLFHGASGEQSKCQGSTISSLFASENVPADILIIDTSFSQGRKLFSSIKENIRIPILTTKTASEVKELVSTILVRIHGKAHRGRLPHCLKLGIAGEDLHFHLFLQTFVKTASEQSVNWLELVRFLPIHLGHSRLTSYVASHDAFYQSLFMDQTWSDFLESSHVQEFNVEITKRITRLFQTASYLYSMSVASARLQCKGIEGDSTQAVVPFICDLSIGSATSESISATAGRSPENAFGDEGTEPLNQSNNEGVSSVSPTHSIDSFDLQVDYWPINALAKKDTQPKVTVKGQYRCLLVSKLLGDIQPNGLGLLLVAKEKNKKGIRLGKKSRVDMSSQVSKVVCSSSKATLYKVLIDGTEWYDVKFFSVSPKAIHFPLGVCSSGFPNRIPNETQC